MGVLESVIYSLSVANGLKGKTENMSSRVTNAVAGATESEESERSNSADVAVAALAVITAGVAAAVATAAEAEAVSSTVTMAVSRSKREKDGDTEPRINRLRGNWARINKAAPSISSKSSQTKSARLLLWLR